MTPSQRVEHIERLLWHSNWRGSGPHGRTITAVLRQVQRLRYQAEHHQPVRIAIPVRKRA